METLMIIIKLLTVALASIGAVTIVRYIVTRKDDLFVNHPLTNESLLKRTHYAAEMVDKGYDDQTIAVILGEKTIGDGVKSND